jgi:DSF synthase
MNAPIDQATLLTLAAEHARAHFDPDQRALWLIVTPTPVPCYSIEALNEIRAFQSQVESLQGKIITRGEETPIEYFVVASGAKGVFNFGGDLRLFDKLIRVRDRDGLTRYAMLCIDTLWANVRTYGAPITTISLVQGDALGGGLECALSSQVIVAEKGAQMGLPEIGFNLFPGMGAYTFLVRRVGPVLAKQMMVNRRIYSAEEMHELGVVDVLAEQGGGEQAVAAFIKKQARSRLGFNAIQRVQAMHDPVTYEELSAVAELWVETALQLSDRDLRTMSRLVRAQENLAARCVQPEGLSLVA